MRVLAIRLQAIGDVTCSFPYFAELRRRYPEYCLDFVTLTPTAEAARGMRCFDHVYEVRPGHNRITRSLGAMSCAAHMLGNEYDVVLDFQDNPVSRLLRRLIAGHRYGTMEKYEWRHAVARLIDAIEQLELDPDGYLSPELPDTAPLSRADFHDPELGASTLRRHGIDPEARVVLLNPAGAFASRNWPLEHYVAAAEALRSALSEEVQFAVVGIGKLHDTARKLRDALGPDLHDLVGRTTLLEAMALVQHVDLAISEDSALMHWCWTAGRPTIGLMGSSPSYWGRPLGRHSVNLDSSNLDCAWCLEPECPLGHYRCLTQYTPERVVSEALRLLGTCGASR